MDPGLMKITVYRDKDLLNTRNNYNTFLISLSLFIFLHKGFHFSQKSVCKNCLDRSSESSKPGAKLIFQAFFIVLSSSLRHTGHQVPLKTTCTLLPFKLGPDLAFTLCDCPVSTTLACWSLKVHVECHGLYKTF